MSSTDHATTDHASGTAPEGDVTGRSILLDEVTKRYRARKPAVDGITLEIPAGKVVMLVGPSGCGKDHDLKMINRLIEPTEGRIVVGDEDVTSIDGDELRRRMGTSSRPGGLFPHMTVAANIAIVPKMLGWSKEKIAARVDELLDLVSLDPDTYRDRFPASSPAASSSAWASPERSPRTRPSCSWTSPSAPSTDHPAAPAGRAPAHPGGAAQDDRHRHARLRRGREAR